MISSFIWKLWWSLDICLKKATIKDQQRMTRKERLRIWSQGRSQMNKQIRGIALKQNPNKETEVLRDQRIVKVDKVMLELHC
uniref:Uncharacterized protein n=1 Tax=Arundo donax TaxID=35708 RepID=A0A0A9CTP1_ARUDO